MDRILATHTGSLIRPPKLLVFPAAKAGGQAIDEKAYQSCLRDPPLEDVVDLLLAVNAGTHAIEHANPRHEHEWRVSEEVALPEGKKLIPGVVTHHTNAVVHPEIQRAKLATLAEGARLASREMWGTAAPV